MHFQNPWVLVLLPFAAALMIYHRKFGFRPAFQFSSGDFLNNLQTTLRTRLHGCIFILRITALVLIILALGRPQTILRESRIEAEGMDIVLAIDISTTMLAEDFERSGRPESRINATKDVIREFISSRRNDRIAIVAFASNACTVAPLTLDHGWLLRNLDRVNVGAVKDGTAIGSGISSALNRLKDSKSKSRVVILLTDGLNNTGRIPPLRAAAAARALDIKVYTVGVGTNGKVLYPVMDVFGKKVYRQLKGEIDEEVLKKIAAMTNAAYFRATDAASLKSIYMKINGLEKSLVEEKGYTEYAEEFHRFLIPGLICLICEALLSGTVLRRIP